MKNYALYYPTIEFQNYEWLWAASLLWDRIYKIVPGGYEPDEPTNVKILCEAGEIGIPLYPGSYASEISEEFISKLNDGSWDAAALKYGDDDGVDSFTRVHNEKVDEKLRKILIAKGKATSTNDWLNIPTNFGAHYMSYLANAVAKKNNLQLVTDFPAAWTCSTYFQYGGMIQEYNSEDFDTHLAAIIIKDFIPSNLMDISPKEILEFRDKRRNERERFFNCIKKSASDISGCEDPKIIRDMIEDIKKDIHESLQDFKNSSDILKVKGWTGIKTLSFPIATQVSSSLNLFSASEMAILGPLGMSLGLITGIISHKNAMRKLEKEYDFSYLLQLSRKWNRTYRNGDYNMFLYRQIEEFIND